MTEGNGEVRELPKGWVKCKLPNFCDLIMGQSPPSETYNTDGDGLPFYQGKNEFGIIYPTPEKYCSVPNKVAKQGDILISVRAPVGPTNICPHKACIGRGLAAIRALEKVKPKFIFYLFRNLEQFISKQGTGTTFKAITKDFLEELDLTVPPLNEQNRIVEKIEELFSDLDQGIESLKTAQKQLKVYRQAVLKWAFEGKLTWYWVKIGDLTTGVEYRSAAKSKKEGRVPVLRMGNIQNCVFDWSDLVFSDDEQEIEKYLLKKGDVLFNRTNSPELVGKTAVYQNERPAMFAGYLIKVNQINELVLSKYLNYFLNSIPAKKHGNKVKTDGVNQSNINGDKLANYPFPYTFIREQDQIVQEIESRFSICDQLGDTIIENLQKAEALRQSILKQAFEGKLVPQEPDDEPAEKLLERIKQEKIKVKKDEQLSIEGI